MTPHHDPILERLSGLASPEISLGLTRLHAVCEKLGRPQDRLPPTIHIAGTNGKGSTTATLAAMSEAGGLRTDVFSSPHLVRAVESVRIAGRLIPEAALLTHLDSVEVAARGIGLTQFEALFAGALLAFSASGSDLLLLEAGMGGRGDVVDVVERSLLTILTPIALDHVGMIGNDVVEIATHKSGLMRRGVRAFSARQSEDAMAAIEAAARATHAPLAVMGVHFDAWAERGGLSFQGQDRFLDLPAPAPTGAHQIDNAGLAVAVALELDLPEAAIAQGLRNVRWPARMQRLKAGPYGQKAEAAGAELWLDGGHNPHAGRALSEALLERQRRDPRPMALIVGLLASKDAGGFFQTLRGLDAPVITVDFEGAAVPAESLAAVARGQGLGAMPADSVDEAVQRALDLGAGRIVICGSLYLAGEVLGASEDTWPV